MKINLKKFRELEKKKLLTCQKHEVCDLLIWNYSHRAQFEKNWTPELRMARGLITDLKGNILYRPFEKFFNWEEHTGEDSKLDPIPNEKFKVFAKLDGSLGILYWMNDEPYLATRGSFVSDQAMTGSVILRRYDWSKINKKYTYLFEIIYPENRIVIDYGGAKAIILLAVIDTETGKTLDTKENCADFPYVQEVPVEGKSIADLKNDQKDNQEGYVLLFDSGVRVKVKFEEYIRLHRLITGVNAKTIWDLLRHKQSIDELMERVPEEFYKWVKDTKKSFEDAYKTWEDTAFEVLKRTEKMESRKEIAEFIKEYNCRSIVFAIIDKKDYSKIIWQMLKPKADKPFKEDIDS